MGYDANKVNPTAKEHKWAARLDKSIETAQAALADGFQFPQDAVKLAPEGLEFYSVLSEIEADFREQNGRGPRTEEVAFIVANLFMMLYRDNRWLKPGVGSTSNPPE